MKNTFFYIFLLSLLFSCSTHKNRFVNRQYHALVTKFNVKYNGEESFKKGLKKVEETYVNDYRNILPIEPFSFYVDQKKDENYKPIAQEDFERAEEKAAKAIQKHSMLIYSEERNSQMDEAYLLLGKSRYYTNRFGPALEAFEHIVKNHKSASLIYETVIWRAKTNIHIGNAAFGKKALLSLLKSDFLSKKERQEAEVGVVMALEKTPDSIDAVITHLEKAIQSYKKGPVATRAAFILGQLHRKKGDISASDLAFEEVIGMKKGLYSLKLQAKLEKINNHIDDFSTEEFLDEVNHLIFIRKNRPYLGKLYHEKALIYQAIDSIGLAKYFFSKSIQKSRQNLYQKIVSYGALGDIFYEEKNYQKAKSYYDSLVSVSKVSDSDFIKEIKRKSKSLEKIVVLEKDIEQNDSLLKIASFTDQEATDFFNKHIAKIREQEKKEKIKELKALENQNKIGFANDNDWYFFNTNLKTKGRKEFVKIWKLRSKNKNWFAKSLIGRSQKEISKDSLEFKPQTITQGLDKYNVDFYKNAINKDPVFLEGISNTRNLNYYELANEYYEKLKEVDLSVDKLKKLINFKPVEDLTMGAYYKLFKIYNSKADVDEANRYKNKLITEFPTSSFTQLVIDAQNSNFQRDDDEACYRVIYELYHLNSIQAAKEEIKEALRVYGDSSLAAKYALLNAYISAKLEGKKQFRRLLKQVKLRFPNTIEAQKAEEILKNQ